jgi:hypothetical protein
MNVIGLDYVKRSSYLYWDSNPDSIQCAVLIKVFQHVLQSKIKLDELLFMNQEHRQPQLSASSISFEFRSAQHDVTRMTLLLSLQRNRAERFLVPATVN